MERPNLAARRDNNPTSTEETDSVNHNMGHISLLCASRVAGRYYLQLCEDALDDLAGIGHTNGHTQCVVCCCVNVRSKYTRDRHNRAYGQELPISRSRSERQDSIRSWRF
jgi:hypothetical protein